MVSALGHLRDQKKGAVALEFCLVAPFLLFVFIGIYDFGFLFFQQMAVQSAADAGAFYAFSQGASGFSATNIASAVESSAYPTQRAISASPAPYQAYGCPNGSSGITVEATQITCSNGFSAGSYAVVSAQIIPTPVIEWPGYPSRLNSAVVVRLQ